MRTVRILVLGTLTALAVVAALTTSWAAPETVPYPIFRVRWDVATQSPTPPRLNGYVYNDSRFRVTNVRLRIIAFDGADRTVDERTSWVWGDIPSRGRGFFAAPVTLRATTYQISVVSYDLVSEGQ